MKIMTSASPMSAAFLPDSIESAPRLAPTVRSSMTVSLAGSAPERSSTARSLARCTVKLPLICPVPPRIGSRMHRRRDHLVVEHDGEGQPDILLGDLAEALGAGGVEAEGHHRLAGAAVEAGLRVDQILAGDQHLVLQHVGIGRSLGAVDELVAGRHLLGGGGLHRVDGGIDQLEFELAGLADQRLQALDVLDARDLHEDAVAALALDAGLGGAEGVDAAPDGLDRGLDRRGHAVRQALIGDGQRDAGVAVLATSRS